MPVDKVVSQRIGVIGSEGSWYVDRLCRDGRRRGHEMLPLSFESMRASTTGARLLLRFGGEPVESLDAVLVRTMPPGSLEQVVSRMDLLNGAAELGVRIVNPPKAIECAVDKYLTTQRLALAGVAVPDTIVCESSEQALAAFQELGGDVVLKPLFGAEGRGIIRLTDKETAWRVFRTLERIGAVLYVQRFIRPANGRPPEDVRILLLDGRVLGSMKRQPATGDFRANAAQAGTCSAWIPTDEELALARKAAEVTGCVFCGVDLMYDECGCPNLIEVNAVPGWKALERTCGMSVTDDLFAWLEAVPS